jgi:hypothetical protein
MTKSQDEAYRLSLLQLGKNLRDVIEKYVDSDVEKNF